MSTELYKQTTKTLHAAMTSAHDVSKPLQILDVAPQHGGVFKASERQTRLCRAYRGQLKLAVYVNYGLLTVHSKSIMLNVQT